MKKDMVKNIVKNLSDNPMWVKDKECDNFTLKSDILFIVLFYDDDKCNLELGTYYIHLPLIENGELVHSDFSDIIQKLYKAVNLDDVYNAVLEIVSLENTKEHYIKMHELFTQISKNSIFAYDMLDCTWECTISQKVLNIHDSTTGILHVEIEYGYKHLTVSYTESFYDDSSDLSEGDYDLVDDGVVIVDNYLDIVTEMLSLENHDKHAYLTLTKILNDLETLTKKGN